MVRGAAFARARCGHRNWRWKTGKYHFVRRGLERECIDAMVALPRLLSVKLGNFRNGRIGTLIKMLEENHPALWAHDLGHGDILIPTRNLHLARSFLRVYHQLRMRLLSVRSRIAAWASARGLNDQINERRELLRRDNTVPTALKMLLAGWRGPVSGTS